ncbi:MAG: hypothetical protein WB763_00840, partial [Terriglobia bacterium]
ARRRVIQALRATRPKPLSNEQVLYCVGVIRLVAFTTAQVYKAVSSKQPILWFPRFACLAGLG